MSTQPNRIRVAVLGASGYTARELIRILLRHPNVDLVRATSRRDAQLAIAELHPTLKSRIELKTSQFDLVDFKAANVSVAFSCLPHAASAEISKQLLKAGIRVIDFSADYRLNDVATFESWYQTRHPDPDRVGSVPYGLPELFRESLRTAPLVANPGCFPTSVILPLAPLLADGLVDPTSIIADSKTGISGAGRTPKQQFHFPECTESVTAYGVGTHRHQPEMQQILQRFCGAESEIIFTPHLIPMERGILSTIYCRPSDGVTVDQILSCWSTKFADEPFIRLRESVPSTRDVSGTNFCDMTVRMSGSRLIIVSAIDNLLKGASGAAVQNFNLMHGLDETTALLE